MHCAPSQTPRMRSAHLLTLHACQQRLKPDLHCVRRPSSGSATCNEPNTCSPAMDTIIGQAGVHSHRLARMQTAPLHIENLKEPCK